MIYQLRKVLQVKLKRHVQNAQQISAGNDLD